MRKLARFILPPFLVIACLAIGVITYRNSTPTISLSVLEANPIFFHGMDVEVETYVSILPHDDDSWLANDDVKPSPLLTFLEFDPGISVDPELRRELLEIRGVETFNRVRVRLRGRAHDSSVQNWNSNAIVFGSRSISLKVSEMTQLSPVELFTRVAY